MKKLRATLLATILLIGGFVAPAQAVTERVKVPTVFTKAVTFQSTVAQTGNSAITGNQTISGTQAVGGASTLASVAVTGAATVGTTLGVTGAVSLTVPLTAANINTSVKTHQVVIPFRGLAVQALDDSTIFTTLVTPGRAGVLTQVSVAAITPPVGGTNTVAVLKNNTTAMLAANFDPTGLTTVVASKPALHATGANIAFTATDTIAIVWTAGAQSTDAIGATVTLEYTLTDL